MAGNLATCRHLKKAANFYRVQGVQMFYFWNKLRNFLFSGMNVFNGKRPEPVTHCSSDSVVTLRYFSWPANCISIRASKTEQLFSKAKRLWCVLQKDYRFKKRNTNYLIPLAPMVQELATRIRQTTSFLHMNYIHLHFHIFVSRYQFTYLDPGRSQRELTVIEQHCAIILASGSLRNVFTCQNINNKNIQRTAIFDDYRLK